LWRINTLGLFLASRQAIPAMRRKGMGAIIVVGATASRRGAAGAAAFAQAKVAQRALAESMARHLWPAGIHVALIVVDGVVGGPVTRSRFTGRPDERRNLPMRSAPCRLVTPNAHAVAVERHQQRLRLGDLRYFRRR
jgi:NAD(P)-dependent dehydrogenase (short-subunit alcohol dehydrogenase family)